jgi:hypothetical protein
MKSESNLIRRFTKYRPKEEVSIGEDDTNKYIFIVKKALKSEGVLIFLLPVFAYSLTYLYQYGGFEYYQLPRQLINFEIPQIISVVFFTITLVLLGLVIRVSKEVYQNLFFNLVKSKTNFIFLIIKIFWYLLVITLIITGFFGYLYEVKSIILKTFSLASALLGLYILVFSIEKFLTKKKGTNKRFFTKNITKLVFGIIIFIFLILFFESLGYLDAKNKKLYYIINTKPECVVLFITSEKIACRSIDRHKQIMFDSLKILPLGGDVDYSISYEEIGPLVMIREYPSNKGEIIHIFK